MTTTDTCQYMFYICLSLYIYIYTYIYMRTSMIRWLGIQSNRELTYLDEFFVSFWSLRGCGENHQTHPNVTVMIRSVYWLVVEKTPLKNMTSSIGMIRNPRFLGKWNWWQPNHQPVYHVAWSWHDPEAPHKPPAPALPCRGSNLSRGSPQHCLMVYSYEER